MTITHSLAAISEGVPVPPAGADAAVGVTLRTLRRLFFRDIAGYPLPIAARMSLRNG